MSNFCRLLGFHRMIQLSSWMHKKFFGFHILALMLAMLWATLGAYSSGAQAQTATYTLTGSVVNSVTGEPIPHALVQMMGSHGNATLTDSEGQFEFDGVTGTRAALVARKPGFFTEQEASLGAGMFSATRVTVGPDAAAAVLKLVPEAVISGQVTGDGEPLENMPVKLVRMRVVDGRRRWEQSGNGITDADGNFRIADLVPGTYLAAFGPSSDVSAGLGRSKSRPRGYAEIFFPEATDLSSAAAIDLSGGQQFEADESLKAEPLYHVTGSVAGYTIPDSVALMLTNASGETMPFAVQFKPETGQFETQAPSGSYNLRAEQFLQESSLQASLPVTVNTDVGGLRLTLQPAASIPVLVRIEGSDSRSKATPSKAPPVSVHLSSSGPSFAVSEYASMPDTSADMSLVIRDVDSGRYFAEVSAGAPFYVQSAQCGGVDLLRDDLSVTSGSRVAPIEVVLRDDGATLTGSLNSGGGPTNGVVFLIPDRNPRQAKVSGAQGTFHFAAVPPGDYNVFAVDNGSGIEYTNPEALSGYLAKAVHLSLPANGSVNLPPLEVINTDAGHAK